MCQRNDVHYKTTQENIPFFSVAYIINNFNTIVFHSLCYTLQHAFDLVSSRDYIKNNGIKTLGDHIYKCLHDYIIYTYWGVKHCHICRPY